MITRPYSLALFGGSFDPIHIGHVGLLEEVGSRLDLDEIHLIPCKQSPHKENAPSATDQQRLEMCQIATQHLPSVYVSDIELGRVEPSYSWMTIEHYQQQFPNASLYWIMGTDQWDVLEKWSRVNLLREALTFIVIERQQKVIPKPGFNHITIPYNHKISATKIRRGIKENQPMNTMLPTRIIDYINKYHLYL